MLVGLRKVCFRYLVLGVDAKGFLFRSDFEGPVFAIDSIKFGLGRDSVRLMFGLLPQEFALTSPQRDFKALNLVQKRFPNLPKSATVIATPET